MGARDIVEQKRDEGGHSRGDDYREGGGTRLLEPSLFRSSKRKSQTNHGRVDSRSIPVQLTLIPDCPSCEGTT